MNTANTASPSPATVLGSEEDFRLLVESVSDYAIIVLGPDGHVATWNPGAERVKGYRAEEIIGKHFSCFYPPEVVQRGFPEHELKVAAKEGRFEDEGWRVRKDGTQFWANVVITAIRGKDGTLRGFGKLTRDLSERKQAQEQIKENAQIKAALKELSDLKLALDAHAIVAITDAQGKITFVNDKFCAISKYSRPELIGQDHRIINSGHHSKEFIHDLWTTIARGQIWKGEIKNKAKDGSFYWVDTTIVPLMNEQGKPCQYVAIRAEITARKQAEDRIQQQGKEIMELSTPVMQVWKGVVVAPLIGSLDSQRTQKFMERLLNYIVDTNSPVALVDITGVPTIDTQTAQHLVETINAVRLLGAQVVLTGVRPAIAQTLVHLSINLTDIVTRSSLAAGLQVALDILHLKVVSKNGSH